MSIQTRGCMTIRIEVVWEDDAETFTCEDYSTEFEGSDTWLDLINASNKTFKLVNITDARWVDFKEE